jgi:hypothetical protein
MAITRKDIKGYEKLYAVTRDGRVYSYPKKHRKRGKYLKPWYLDRYARVPLSKNSIVKKYSVHRLVAEAYIPNPNNYAEVNHINGKPFDNRVENLEWCDNSYNHKHAWKTGLQKATRLHRLSAQRAGLEKRKLTMEDAETIRKLYADKIYNGKELSKKYNVSDASIYYIVNNKTYINKGDKLWR